METNRIYNMDCIQGLNQLPENSVDLVIADPPYNMGKAYWDKIGNYVEWCGQWIAGCERVLKQNGVLYFFHNNLEDISRIMCWIKENTGLVYKSFLIWDKGNYRAFVWKNRDPNSHTALRKWFQSCEYCLHYVMPEGDKPQAQRRYTHHCDANHKNVISVPTMNAADKRRIHITQKPEELIRRLIRVSSNPNDIVVDPFMGSGTTAVAAIQEGRSFIGFEKDMDNYQKSIRRIDNIR